LDFKDRLAEMHLWLLHEFGDKVHKFVPHEALPDSLKMANLLKILSDLTMNRGEQAGHKLVFYGMNGAV
jgi:hypothetical protein